MIDITKIAKWVVEKLEHVPVSQTFGLFHNTEMMGPDLVAREHVSKGELQAEAERIAEACYAAAQEHSTAFTGRQRFKLVAEGENERALGQLAFTMGSADSAMMLPGGFGSEDGPPEMMGSGPIGHLVKLIGQQMRHTEVMTRLAIDSHSHLAGENASLRKHRDNLEERRYQVFEAQEELASRKHERDMDLIETAAAQERKNKAIAMMMDYMPEVAKRLFTRPMFEGADVQNSPALGSGEISVATAQGILRELFKQLDREPIYEVLDGGGKAMLDSLLGLGDDPKTTFEFRQSLVALWKQLPSEITDGIAEQAVNSKHAVAFVELMRVEDA